MIFSDMLEIAIGLAFIFMMLSLALTSLNEMVEVRVKARATLLLHGIEQLLAPSGPAAIAPAKRKSADPSPAVKALFDHPMLRGMMRSDLVTAIEKRQLPSYVPARNFAQALLDQALAGKLGSGTSATLPALAPLVERLRFAAEAVPDAQLRRALIGAADAAKGDLDEARAHLEQWFASATDRIAGWYKRRTQIFTFVVGLVLAVVLNINTLTIANRLATDSTARRAIGEQAAHVTDPAKIADPVARIEALGLPIGWEDGASRALLAPVTCVAGQADVPVQGCGSRWSYVVRAGGVIEIAGGFLLTALAVTLGAPFWFDVLNRLMVIRATVKPAEKSREEGSEDRQTTGGDAKVVAVVAGAGAPAPVVVDGGIDPSTVADGTAAGGILLEDETGEPMERDGRAHTATSPALAADAPSNGVAS